MQCFTQHIYMNKNIWEFCMTVGWISYNNLNKNLRNTFENNKKNKMKKKKRNKKSHSLLVLNGHPVNSASFGAFHSLQHDSKYRSAFFLSGFYVMISIYF